MARNTNQGPDLSMLEPPETEPCAWCDGQGEVDVMYIRTCLGRLEEVIVSGGGQLPAVRCPRCDAQGAEPEPDPCGDPRIP